MKPTQEQVIAWAQEAGIAFQTHQGISGRLRTLTEGSQSIQRIETIVALAYSAGRKDENEAIAQLFEGAPKLVSAALNTHGGCLLCGFVPAVAVEVIRARREQ